MITAVIFDMDGVVVNIENVKREAWRLFFQEVGVSVSEKKRIDKSGMTSRDVLGEMFPGIDEETLEKYMVLRRKIYRQTQEKYDISLVKGVDIFIKDLRNCGYATALATSSQKVNTDIALDKTGIGNLFDAIFTAENVVHGKPDPAIYLKTAACLHAFPQNCLVFEDSFRGVEAGIRAGMVVCLVETTHTADEMNGNPIWRSIRDFTEISVNDVKAIS